MLRTDLLEQLRKNPAVSVLIIGGGINGIGVLRDLALQGVDALLVEKSDFCAGTSAASGRVAHGGIRYLENGEFRLVREALHERNRLLVNAPHCVEPLPITMPAYSWMKGFFHAASQFLRLKSRPGDRGAVVLKIGMALYDAYSGKGALPLHRFVSRKQALAERPGLNPKIKCVAVYYDAKILYPERLCLELILDAERSSPGARALNYVSVASAHGDTVTLRDELTGATIDVQPKIVVNATGAWIDLANSAMHRESRLIGGTKGSHLVVDHPELHKLCQGHMLFYVNTDARICIFYPLGHRVLIGTTDIPADDPDSTICTEDETDYLLKSVQHVFPDLKLDRSQIVYTFSGIRPLPRSDALTTGQISRDHSDTILPPGDGLNFAIHNLVGGKWTTYRAFAEQVTDRLLGELGKQRVADTRSLPVGGGRDFPTTESARAAWFKQVTRATGQPAARLTQLLERYGTRADEIAIFCGIDADAPLQNHSAYTHREILFLAQHERVERLDDVILRRTMIGMLGETTIPLLEEVAAIMGGVRGWSAEQRAEEVERVVELIRAKNKIDLRANPPTYVG